MARAAFKDMRGTNHMVRIPKKYFIIVWITLFLFSMIVSSDSPTEIAKFTSTDSCGNKKELAVYLPGNKVTDSIITATVLTGLFSNGSKNANRSVKITLL